MAKHKRKKSQSHENVVRKPSKRDKRMKLIVYLMIAAMLGSLLTSVLPYIL